MSLEEFRKSFNIDQWRIFKMGRSYQICMYYQMLSHMVWMMSPYVPVPWFNTCIVSLRAMHRLNDAQYVIMVSHLWTLSSENCNMNATEHEISKLNFLLQKNHKKYRILRNKCVKLRLSSLRKYFSERSFWPNIKPFLTNKNQNNGNTMLVTMMKSLLIQSVLRIFSVNTLWK